MTAAALLAQSYLSEPENFGLNERQHAKLNRVLTEREKVYGLSRSEMITHIVALAQRRSKEANAPTIYVQNMGSSGSHWFSAMLGLAFGVYPGGEMYFPQALLREIDELNDTDDFSVVLQSVMLSHVIDGDASRYGTNIVNTAHIHSIDKYARYDVGAIKILLLRNPVDVVISRTFRKSEYRDYLNKTNESDMEYAKKNIDYVAKFLESALEDQHDLVVRYEDLTKQPVETLKRVSGSLALNWNPDRVRYAVAQTQRTDTGTVVSTNAFAGQDIPIPEDVVAMVREQLIPLCTAAGY